MIRATVAKKIRVVFYATLSVLTVPAVLVALLLGTSFGRQALLDRIAQAVTTPDFSLAMQGLHVGSSWSLDHLTIGDREGIWLEVANASITPSLPALLRGMVVIDRLAIERLRLARLATQESETDGSTTDIVLPRVHVRSLEVGHIHLGADLLGQEALLTVAGSFRFDHPSASSTLSIARLDRPGDELRFDLAYHDSTRSLDLDLRLFEAAGGLLHDLLSVNATDGIALTATGQGRLAHWPLTLQGQISDLAQIEASAIITDAQDIRIRLEAAVRPGPSWTGITALPERPLDIKADAVWSSPHLHLDRLDVRSATEVVTAAGVWDSEAQTMDLEIELDTPDLSWALPADIVSGPTRSRITARIDQAGLAADSLLFLTGWSLYEVPLDQATARIQLAFPFTDTPWQVRTDLELHLPSMPQDLQNWTANATASGSASILTLDALTLTSPAVTLEANASLTDTLVVNSRAQLRSLGGLENQPFSATLDAKLCTQPADDSSNVAGTVELHLTDPKGLPAFAADLLGPDILLTTGFDLAGNRLRLADTVLRSRTTVSLHADLDLDSQALHTSFTATLPQLLAGGLAVPQNSQLAGLVSGTLTNPDLNLTADIVGASIFGYDLRNIRVTTTAVSLTDAPQITLQTSARMQSQDVALSVAARNAGQTITFEHCTLTLPGTNVKLAGVLNLASLVFSGEADADSTDLSFLGQALGLEMQGQAQIKTHLRDVDSRQRIEINAQGQNLVAGGLSAAKADFSGGLEPFDPIGTGSADLACHSVVIAGQTADQISARIRPDGQNINVRLEVLQAASDTNLAIATRITPAQNRFSLSGLEGSLLGQTLGLDKPLDVILTDKDVSWNHSAIFFGPATLQTQGRSGRERTDITARLENLETGLLDRLVPGLPQSRIDAGLHITGTEQAPQIRLNVTANDIAITNPGLDELPVMNATLLLQCSATTLEAKAALSAEQAATLEARLTCPVQAGLFNVHVPETTPLSGHIRGHVALALLPRLLNLDDQILSGSSQSEFTIGGTWKDPALHGATRINGASYENFRTGTILENLNLEALAQGSLLQATFGGTDGKNGKLTGQATLDLDDFNYSTSIKLNQCQILRQDLIQASANGTLTIIGSADSAQLRGSLQLEPVAIHLPRSTPPDLAHIDVEEINAGTPPARTAVPTRAYPVELNLTASIPGRLTVQGRGLDSEWAGNLIIEGTQTNPIVRGEISLLRGRFDFLDRSFDLTRGVLALSGETPPNPYIDVLGETHVLDNLIQVHLHGPARSFRLDLLSIPPLPQDELLAMILFGRSMSQISPLQAVQLAQAAAELTGAYTGPGLLDSLKSRLGLQEVDVTKDEHDNTSVGIGGYLGGKYYIRTQSSVSGRDSTRVEIQLTPKISVETEVGADSRQGGGINWQYDY